MKEFNLLEKLERAKAPPDFEQKVLALLSERKEKKRVRKRQLSFSFAGAFAFLLVFFVVFNVFILQKKEPMDLAGVKKGMPAAFGRGGALEMRDYIPIIETVDYSNERQSLTHEPKTIYILEQVSENILKEIKY